MLQQRFIELGEGFGDVYELLELMKTNHHRLYRTFIFSAPTETGNALSLVAAFTPADESQWMPLYICREGIYEKEGFISKRRQLFENQSNQLNQSPVWIELRHSSTFTERILFYQYVIGILRLNNLLPPLQ